MHVAKVEYSEAVKKRWQLLEHNVVALDENPFRIPARAPIKTRQLQGVSNDGMDRIPIPYVKEDEALAEDLRLVVRLDAQSLSRVERSETLLQCMQDIFVHGTTSSEIGSTFHGSKALPDTSEYCFRPTAWEHEVLEDFPAFTSMPIGSATIFARGPWRCADGLLPLPEAGRLSWADHFEDGIA
jgi:hypothetical protein